MTIIRKNFTVPSYYTAFTCKAGDCRHTCCEGLEITISQAEYFRLAGLTCSKQLRSRLDVSLHVLSHPDEYKYACITPDFFGRCRMLDEKGLCLLQSECGYEALDAACRYFPRSPKLKLLPECSTSNACEKTLELLLDHPHALKYETCTLSFDLAGKEPFDKDPLSSGKTKIHRYLVGVMAKFLLPIPEKVHLIARLAAALDPKNTEELPSDFSSDSFISDLYFKLKDDASKKELFSSSDQSAFLHRLLQKAQRDHPDLSSYADMGEKYLLSLNGQGKNFGISEEKKALRDLAGRFPEIDADAFLSRVIANCMFYNYFPYAAERPAEDEGKILSLMVSLLLLIIRANLNNLTTVEDLIDLLAAFFRMTDLTDFSAAVYSLMYSCTFKSTERDV